MTQRILHEHTIRAGKYIIFTFMRYDSILMKVASVWHNCYKKKKKTIYKHWEKLERGSIDFLHIWKTHFLSWISFPSKQKYTFAKRSNLKVLRLWRKKLGLEIKSQQKYGTDNLRDEQTLKLVNSSCLSNSFQRLYILHHIFNT